jgi:DNA polymerase-4
MTVFASFSDQVQQLSVDEAFLDMTGTTRLFGPPEEAARKLKAAVLHATGLAVSIGVASNKYVAKIASGYQKPDGLTLVPPGGEEAFMLSLPLEKIWGAGAKTQELFRRAGFHTPADIHAASLPLLISLFGKSGGAFLYRAVRGEGAEDFAGEPKSRSISVERTFDYDLTDRGQVETALLDLCQTLMFRLNGAGQSSRTVGIKIRYSDFTTQAAQTTLSQNVINIDELFAHIRALWEKKHTPGLAIRLLGISLQNLRTGTDEQGDLFDMDNRRKKHLLEQSVFQINQRYRGGLKKARIAAPASPQKNA